MQAYRYRMLPTWRIVRAQSHPLVAGGHPGAGIWQELVEAGCAHKDLHVRVDVERAVEGANR
ncbi:hypothetical protein J7I98_40440 [Streptomyces sp. ISL-98]|uniref:hypothetical protein n=1 Tax=Streptomyces sp. ISL-98 TaxID=2819192 RepID=UPI001BE88E98|nr:hypothetical protein [Streptomyces sp. ISL-98]MBT2511910.1 hypothetical protein [Streptomyces sp. ISL-98]